METSRQIPDRRALRTSPDRSSTDNRRSPAPAPSTAQLPYQSVARQEIHSWCCCWRKYPRTKKKSPHGSRSRPAPTRRALATIRSQNSFQQPEYLRPQSAADAVQSPGSSFRPPQTASHKTEIVQSPSFRSASKIVLE